MLLEQQLACVLFAKVRHQFDYVNLIGCSMRIIKIIKINIVTFEFTFKIFKINHELIDLLFAHYIV